MTLYVALLRGVNVGGRRLPMAELRAALAAAGLPGARTYIQSGNVLVEAADPPDAVGERIRVVIEHEFALAVPVLVVTATELAEIVAANPYPHEPDPKRLHAIVLTAEPDAAGLAALDARVAVALAKGSTDSVTIVGRVAYLHTPGGFGVSELAKAVTTGAHNPLARGTARNWATMRTLLELAALD